MTTQGHYWPTRQHNKQDSFCGSPKRLSCDSALNLFSFFFFYCCTKKEVGFFNWIESHGGGSEIFGGLHPFLKKKMSR